MDPKQALINLKNDYQAKLNQVKAEREALISAEHDKAIEEQVVTQCLADIQAHLNLVP